MTSINPLACSCFRACLGAFAFPSLLPFRCSYTRKRGWRLASRGDFSLVDKVYHPDYRAFDAYAEVEVNLEAEKAAVETFSEILTATNSKVLSESNDFLRIHRYNRHRDAEVFASVTTSITYKDGLIITQQSEVEELDYDPSEGQDWIWEDFE